MLTGATQTITLIARSGQYHLRVVNTTTILMYQSMLEELGLSPNEAKIYETLVEKGESSVSGIALAAGIHRRNAYDVIQRLIDKGLCFQIFSTTENKYNAVDPDKLTEVIAEKQNKLLAALPGLKKKFSERLAPEEAYIYRGLEGQKNIWRDVIRVGADSYAVGAKGGWFEPKLEANRNAFFKEANRKKIKFFQLFDYEIKAQDPDFPKRFPGELQYKFLPKEYSTNSLIQVFGDYFITYTGLEIKKLSEKTVFFIIKSKNLAESYRTWFWYMWKQSSKT
ncbi:MAG: Transcriptional regulator TrmB [Microgenomates group bacterium GW2011_GWC1_46_20]|nr:MAG: Transcriptional regulator TrmB [Microgenomates group bacterium GW2011_GWC1_46_20]